MEKNTLPTYPFPKDLKKEDEIKKEKDLDKFYSKEFIKKLFA